MVQPKTPPLSIRLGDERLAKIDAYAALNRLTRHAAVLALIDRGLAVLPSERAAQAQGAAEVAALAEQATQRKRAGADAPYVPLHKPKAFNPQPKPGKKR